MKLEVVFTRVMDQLTAGALDIHDRTIGQLNSGHPDFKAPRFFGDKQALYPVNIVFREGMALSQEWIEVNYRTLMKSISILCSEKEFNQYAELYLKSAYYEEPLFKTMLAGIDDHIGNTISEASAEYFKIHQHKMWSGITDDRRRVTDRVLFTYAEHAFAKKLHQVCPELAYSIVVYQSIFASYFADLQARIQDRISSEGSTPGLCQALAAITNLSQFKNTSNIISHFVPAIALIYAKNHYQSLENMDQLIIDPCYPPNIQDICEGVEFALKQGSFVHIVGDRTSMCPVKNALVSYSKTRIKALEPEKSMELIPYKSESDPSIWPDDVVYPLDEEVFNHRPGAMIYSIYKAIAFDPSVKERLETLRHVTVSRSKDLAPTPPTEEKGCPFFGKS